MHFLEFMFVVTGLLVLMSFRSPTPPQRGFYIGVAVLFAAFIAFVWLSAIRKSQLAPHHITQSINGHVIREFWTTNPMYVESYAGPVADAYLPAALQSGVQLRTNYYWHVWSIFR